MIRDFSPSQGNYLISDERDRLDPVAIQAYLTRSYWSPGIPIETVQKAIDHSVCVGIYDPEDRQVGFARLVTDQATFANLVDVYVLEDHRGLGLSKAMMAFILDLPFVAGLRRFTLNTLDAHKLYEQFGFVSPSAPQSAMEILKRDIYQTAVS